MKQVNIRIPQRILALMMGLFLSIGAYAQITVQGHHYHSTSRSPAPSFFYRSSDTDRYCRSQSRY